MTDNKQENLWVEYDNGGWVVYEEGSGADGGPGLVAVFETREWADFLISKARGED